MDKKMSILVLILVVILLGIFGIFWWYKYGGRSPSGTGQFPQIGNIVTNTPGGTSGGGSQDGMVRVTSLTPNQTVKSPLRITGEARGTWYFEASFPVKIVDANGNVLGVSFAQAQGEWMTEDFVPFIADITFTVSSAEIGELVLEKDNPAGLPQYADERRIPIRFETKSVAARNVKLYYYNPSRDENDRGDIQCSRSGLHAVERTIPRTITPVQDAIRLLLRGELTPAERARGITTEYPLPGFALRQATLSNGILTLTFDDPENKTSGGACRVGILWMQIEETVKQFPEVKEVRFRPEELFQP